MDQDESGGVETVARPLAAQYDSTQCQLVQQWFTDVTCELDKFVQHLVADEMPSLRTLEAHLDGFWEMGSLDPAIVVEHLITDDRYHLTAPSLTRRSTYLSALATVVAREHGMSREDCFKVGQAALLHDLALVPPLLAKIQASFDTEDDKNSVIPRHSSFSSELFSARTGIADLVRIVINQVHEQMDGSGYPRGIPGHLINLMARVINLSDAFLTLIAAGDAGEGYVPGDAIAYLVSHTSRGAFDLDVMRSFLNVVTFYGVGSRVALEDGRQVIVLRAANNPLQPLVYYDDSLNLEDDTTGNDDGPAAIIDLQTTGMKITGPLLDPNFEFRKRMPKSKMAEVLWRSPACIYLPT